MNTANVRHKRLLFAILFGALAFDLGARMIGQQPLASSDLASTSEQECATLIRDGITSNGRAGCVVTFADGTRAEGEIRKVKRTAKNTDWSAPKPEPQPPLSLPEVERPKLKDCKAKELNTTAKRAACTKDNADLEDAYKKAVAKRQGHLDADAERRRGAAAKPAEDQGEDEFLIEVNTQASDCDECRATGSFSMAKTEAPQSIAQKMVAEAKKQQAMLADAKKKRQAELAAKAKFDKEVADCIRSPEGKGYNAMEKLNCQAASLSTASDRAEANQRFTSIRSTLNQMLQSGSQEDREQAMNIAEQIARDTRLPRDMRDTAQVLRVAGRYQSQVMNIADGMAKAPPGSAAYMFHMNRLAGLQNQMQYEMGNSLNIYAQRASMSLGAATAYDELSNWFGLLTGSFQTAMMPTTFSQGQFGQLTQNQLLANGTGNLNVDNQALMRQQQLGQLGINQNSMLGQQYGPGTLVNRNLQPGQYLNTNIRPGMAQNPGYGPGTMVNAGMAQPGFQRPYQPGYQPGFQPGFQPMMQNPQAGYGPGAFRM